MWVKPVQRCFRRTGPEDTLFGRTGHWRGAGVAVSGSGNANGALAIRTSRPARQFKPDSSIWALMPKHEVVFELWPALIQTFVLLAVENKLHTSTGDSLLIQYGTGARSNEKAAGQEFRT